ncbi:hypothetical protein N7G274_003825 [Stereocaulon virgatum]|uniref:Uncharacterized protein n=1 Tax=Stereocaulon virgatum TaxID=373712 RepID=A0ABR4AEL6_9LECA
MLSRTSLLSIVATSFSLVCSSKVQQAAQSSNAPEIANAFVIPKEPLQTISHRTVLPSSPSVASFGPLSNLSLVTFNRSELALNATAVGFKSSSADCDKGIGEGLNVQSCVQAYNSMTSYLAILARTRNKVTMGLPSQGIFDIPGFMRFLSTDGVCLIDLSLISDTADSTTTTELVMGATTLLRECVEGHDEPQGGRIYEFGEKRQIDMVLSHRGPDPLPTCQNPPPTGPPPQSCFSLFKSMPSEDFVQSFGQRGSNADVEVPRALHGADERCVLTLFTRGPMDWVSWVSVYLTAIEIDAICVRRGKRGFRSNLGRHGNIHITLTDSAQPGPALLSTF